MIKTKKDTIYVKNSTPRLRTSFNIDKEVIKNHINTATADRLTNKNPSTDSFVYSTRDPYFSGVGNFIRNTSCWLNGVNNISCFSPAQLSGANWFQRAGTLVSPRHVVFVDHFRPAILAGGTPLIFVDDNNNVIRRNLLRYETDIPSQIAMGLLDSDVPSNIKVAKVLPKNYATYMTVSSITTARMLVVALNQQQRVLIKESHGLTTLIFSTFTRKNINIPNLDINHPLYSFTATAIAGDSGQPIFYIIDNELVFLTVWSTSVTGPALLEYYSFMNSMMQKLGGGYQLTPIDLQAVYDKYR
jgi:hypothetical protein